MGGPSSSMTGVPTDEMGRVSPLPRQPLHPSSPSKTLLLLQALVHAAPPPPAPASGVERVARLHFVFFIFSQ